MAKDRWDKWQIVGEIFGKVWMPIVVAGATLWFNSQTSHREQAARMAQIAVGILAEQPDYSAGETKPDPLWDWAVTVLQQPGEIVPLDDKAAEALREQGLPPLYSLFQTNAFTQSIHDAFCVNKKVDDGMSEDEAREACTEDRMESFQLFLEKIKQLN